MIKKALVLAVVVLAAVALVAPAFAGEVLRVRGTVTKIDADAKSVTIKQKGGEEVTVFVENAGMLSRVREGEKGEARYVVKDGKNVAERLSKVREGCG